MGSPDTVLDSRPDSAEPSGARQLTYTLHSLREYPTIVREILAGGLAGATAKSAVAPLERCKILFQTGRLHAAGIIPTLTAIFAAEGPKGFFRGNGASVLRIIPYSSIHFGLYEHYRRMAVTAIYPPRVDHHGVSPFVDLVAGSAAGATAVLVTYPLDLVRTRLAYMTEAKMPSMEGNRNAIDRSGGLVAVQARTKVLEGEKTHPSPAAAAAALHRKRPIHFLRTPDPHHSIRGVFLETIRGEGLHGLYRGIGASMYGILPYAGLKFFVYQHLKQAYLAVRGREAAVPGEPGMTRSRLPIPAMLVFGGMAGLVAQTATYPLDVVRRRMQVEGLRKREILGGPVHHHPELLPSSTPAALIAIARRQGWRVLFSGLSINYMKVIPSTAIGFTLYDYLKSALDLPTHL